MIRPGEKVYIVPKARKPSAFQPVSMSACQQWKPETNRLMTTRFGPLYFYAVADG
jgi:hypothetical protein